MATTRATMRMNTSAIKKILMLRPKPARISGNEALKSSQLKKVSLTVGHPGELTTIRVTTPKTTSVLTAPIKRERRLCPR
jgi:hypothetical protein